MFDTLTETKEASIFNLSGEDSIFDDPVFTNTRNYTSTTELLRILNNALLRFLESWERFEEGEIQCFFMEEDETLREQWNQYLTEIQKESNTLRSLKTILQQKIDTFNNRRNAVSSSRLVKTELAC